MSEPTKNEAMQEAGFNFGDLIEELQNKFHSLPAPESEELKWIHVETAKKICGDLKEIIAYLSK